MKLFDIFKNRKYHDIFKKNGIETISCDKLHKSKMNFVKSLEEENEGRVQLLGEKTNIIYLISSVGAKDIKYKKSYLRHIDIFEKDRICNLFYGTSISKESVYLSDSLSSELDKGMKEEDIFYKKDIMRQILVSSLDIQDGHIPCITILAPTDLKNIINYKCNDIRVEKVVRNIGKKLSKMSEEERFILFINCIRNIFDSVDENTTDMINNAINEIVEYKFNGKQYESRKSTKQKEKQEKEDIISFINLSVKEKYEVKRKMKEYNSSSNPDITYIMSIKTGDKICLSPFPIKEVEYKKYLRKFINNMFNEEKSDFLLYSLLDIKSLIEMLEYVPNWLYEHEPKYSPSYRLSRGTKGYYVTNEIDVRVLNKYNELVKELKQIETKKDYIEFYTKYMYKLVDHIKEKYGIDDEYQLHLLDQFIDKCLAEIIGTQKEIPYASIRNLKTYTKDELKDIFYKKNKEPKIEELRAKLPPIYKRKKQEKEKKEAEEKEREEKIRKQKEELMKDKLDVISSIIAEKTSLKFKKTMTFEDIKKEILKCNPSFTEDEVLHCTRLVLEKSSQILTSSQNKELGFKWGRKK